METVCIYCNRAFSPHGLKPALMKYCSDTCRQEAWNQWRRDNRSIEHTCEYCNNKFLAKTTQKYCSESCLKKYWADKKKRPMIEKHCYRCKKSFVTNKKRKNFCDKECLKKYRGEKQQLLLSSYKQQVFNKFNNKCSCCGETNTLFLTIEHCNNDGLQHRKSGKVRVYLDTLNDTEGKYTLLCMNCNWARGQYGHCPHELGDIKWPLLQ